MSPDDEYIQRDRGWHPPAFTSGYKTNVPRLPLLSLQNSLSEVTGPHDNDLLLNYQQGGEVISERTASLRRRELPEITVLGSSAISHARRCWPNRPPVSLSFSL